MQTPRTRYAKSGDLNIAYQVVGDGPIDLVFVPGIMTNVELAWEEEHWANFLVQLASFSRLILFDRRGVGLSDRVTGVPALEERADDVRAVLDAVGSERAAPFGAGDGGAMFALFAATYPERTSALVLFSPQPRWTQADDYPWGFDDLEARRWVEVELDTAGDGFFATFDGPARAIRCARAIVDASADLGVELRAGLHTGECERIEGKVGGIAVHLGARVAGLARPGEVLVSSTVKDLVAGSGLGFSDRGVHELRGVPGEWRL